MIVEAVEERHDMLSVPGLSRQSARVIFDRCLKCASFDFQGTYLANFKRCPTPMCNIPATVKRDKIEDLTYVVIVETVE